MSKDNDFIIIGCDGIWDCIQDHTACDFIIKKLNAPGVDPFKVNLSEILAEICDNIVAKNVFTEGGIGCDNMTCLLIQFK